MCSFPKWIISKIYFNKNRSYRKCLLYAHALCLDQTTFNFWTCSVKYTSDNYNDVPQETISLYSPNYEFSEVTLKKTKIINIINLYYPWIFHLMNCHPLLNIVRNIINMTISPSKSTYLG